MHLAGLSSEQPAGEHAGCRRVLTSTLLALGVRHVCCGRAGFGDAQAHGRGRHALVVHQVAEQLQDALEQGGRQRGGGASFPPEQLQARRCPAHVLLQAGHVRGTAAERLGAARCVPQAVVCWLSEQLQVERSMQTLAWPLQAFTGH